MKACSLCARENPPSAVVCAYCGASFTNLTATNPTADSPPIEAVLADPFKTEITLVGIKLEPNDARRSSRVVPLAEWLFFARALPIVMGLCGALLLALFVSLHENGSGFQTLRGAMGIEYAYYFELVMGGGVLVLAGVLSLPAGIRSLCATLFGLAGFLLGALMLRLHLFDAADFSRSLITFLLSTLSAATLGTMGLLQLFGILMQIAPAGRPRDVAGAGDRGAT